MVLAIEIFSGGLSPNNKRFNGSLEIHMKKTFRLSNTGRLAAMVSVGLSLPAIAGGITAAGMQSHQAAISQAQNGAQIVNIVAPNQKGLSHNTYGNYNVDNHGAVLNNALTAGNSHLAGHLNANNKFHGQAAKVILNEVITRNPSLLLGKQEVFGMAADYVLANPNGITCNGCGFINTSKESLVVGKPLVEQGKLNGYTTMNNTQSLVVGNKGIQGNQVLNMIAPKISIQGNATATDTINAISGQNTINAQGAVITSNQQHVGNLDSYYLGSMQAGKINLVNTDAGSGINLSGNLHANNLLTADAKGRIDVEGAKLQGGDISLSAQKLNIHGKFKQSDDNWADPENYKNYRGQIDHTKSSHSERLVQTEIAGKGITLVGYGDNHITAADINGTDIEIKGGKVTLDAQRLNNIDNERDHRWLYTWDHNDSNMTRQSLQKTTSVHAKNQLTIHSNKSDVDMVAAKLNANEVHINAARNIHINGTIAENVSEHTLTRKNEGKGLLTGRVSQIDREQTYIASDINGENDVTLHAGGNLLTLGAQIHSGGDIRATSQKDINIATGAASKYTSAENHFNSWGGIGGGADATKAHDETITTATNMTADGKILLSGENGVAITGSIVNAKQGGFVQSSKGTVRVDSATNKSSDSLSTRSGGAFNITGYSNSELTHQQQASGSSVKSDTNLTLDGNSHVNVTGSDISAKDNLNINSNGNINIQAGKTETHIVKDNTSLHGTGHAKKVSDKQYSAGVGVEHTHHHEDTKNITHNDAKINGGNIEINAGSDVAINGSKVTSTGNTNIAGNNVTIGSVQDTSNKETTDNTVKVGIYATGGADKGALGISSDVTHTAGTENSIHEKGSTTNIGGDLTINANGSLTQHASNHNIKGSYNANADTINNTAGINSETTNSATTHVGVDVSVGADYSKTSRPLIDGVEKLLHGDIVGAGETAKNTKVDLTELQGGIKVNTSHEKNGSVHSTVTSNQIHAGNININAQGNIKDQATDYNSNHGVTINSDSYKNQSVNAHNETTHSKVDVNVGVAVGTKTGADIAVHGKVDTHYQSAGSKDNLANTGSITGDNIAINANNKASLEGTQISANQGVNINAHNGVDISQAKDTHSKNTMDVTANVGIDVTTTGDVRNMGGKVGGNYSDSASHDSHGIAGSISGNNINIQSDGNIHSQGTKISGSDITVNASGKVSLTGTEDSHSASSQHYGGDIHAGKNHNKDNSFGGNIGGGINLGHSSESSSNTTGGNINGSGNVTITSNDQSNNAINIEGSRITGQHTNIAANEGGINIHSATNNSKNSSWNVGVSTDMSESHTLNPNPFKGIDKNNSIAGKANIDYANKTTKEHNNSHISGDALTINSQGNVNIAGGNVNVSNMDGKIGGNLTVSSQKDQTTSVGINGKLSVPKLDFTHSQNPTTQPATPAKPLTNADIKNQAIGIAKKLKDAAIGGGYHSDNTDKVTNQSGINTTGNMNVYVDGNVNANGANINAHKGSINAQSTKTTDITGNDSHHHINANLTDVVKGMVGLGKNTKPNYQNTNATPVTVSTVTYGSHS